MRARILCFGAGGHATVIVDLLQLLAVRSGLEIVGFVAKGDPADVLGVPVLGVDEDLPRIVRETQATHFIVSVGSVRGGGKLRPRLFADGIAAGLEPFTAIHPSAIVASSTQIGAGAVILAGTVLQARSRIGANTIINTRASLDHDGIVGEHSHLAPGVTCSGGVRIGQNVHIGTGAILIENISIGDGSTVGAGAVVLSDCPPQTTMVGVPARPKH